MTESSLYRSLTERTRAQTDVFITTDQGEEVSYRGFHEAADRMADAMRHLGVARGTPLITQLPKSFNALVVYMAALRIGAVYVPLNPAYTTAELEHYVSDAQPTLYVGPHDVGTSQVTLVELVAMADKSNGGTPDTSAEGSETATMLYTSGTTGNPKGAPATAAGLLRNGHDLAERWQFREDDTLLHVLPLFHVHGLFVAMHCALLTGCRVRLHNRFDAQRVISDLPASTVMMGVPTMYTRLLAEPTLDETSTADMRLFTSGSAPLNATAHIEFTARTGHRIVERYGLTETGILTSNRIGEEMAGTVGHPLPGIELRIGSDDGPVPTGAVGEVQVRGVTVTAGYWRAPAATASALTKDQWFRTGDIAIADATGRITLLGREKDVVISGGLNIYPPEIETAIIGGGLADEVAVIGVPHPDLGEAVVAVTTAPVDVHDGVLSEVASFKHPKAWVVQDPLPRNAMGKVQKHVLRDRHKDLFA